MVIEPLPIDAILPEIVDSVRNHPITLLQAEPGAGKTTRVPQSLIRAGFSQVYVLEPRRLAARMAARRVSQEMGEAVGGSVGFQVRFEQIGGSHTKLWFLTEGVLTRKLLHDRTLQHVRVVILDEFHERHLDTDIALALLRKLQRSRSDLRLVIMSATLGGADLADRLRNPPLLRAPGRAYPVVTRFSPDAPIPMEQQVAGALAHVLKETEEHVLIFLPGAAEIRKTIQQCHDVAGLANARLLPLHGDLGPDDQDSAVAPSSARKIICSTNVAESSITIDGVRAVIDSGLARVASHSPWSGIARLRVDKISQASAIQRAGRAGRTAPGLAIRLFSEQDFLRRPEQTAPEILRADLVQALLQLAVSGYSWTDLEWLDVPPLELIDHATGLLEKLGAVKQGHVTDIGRRLAALPLHPRLGRFLIEAVSLGASGDACELAAKLSEGRIRLDVQDRNAVTSDVEALRSVPLSYTGRRLMQSLLDGMASLVKQLPDVHAIEKAIICGYPDRVARKRGELLLLANGSRAKLDPASAVRSEYLVGLEIDDRDGQTGALIRIASPVQPDWLLDLFPEQVEARETMAWNREAERVEQVNSLHYGHLVIDESRGAPTDAAAASALLVEKALESGLDKFVDANEFNQLLQRVRFAATHATNFLVPADLVTDSLRQVAAGLKSFTELRAACAKGGLLMAIQANLPMRLVDEVAPAYVMLPTGRRAKIEYHEEQAPSVASRLQDFFGMKESPTVARGKVPLVVHLLAPNHRPVQMTTDLLSFWKNLYPQVRRELSRRYPRHAWPEEPGELPSATESRHK